MPLGVALAGANRPDYQLTRETLESIPLPRPTPTPEAPQGLRADQGYFYQEVLEVLDEFGYTAHLRPVGSGQSAAPSPAERQAVGVKARRWVVERTHSWLNRYRGLLIRWCKKPENYLALLHFACALLAFRASGLLR